MKRFITTSLFLLIGCLVFTSCSKEKDDDTSNSLLEQLNSRSSVALDISYDLQKISKVEPVDGDLEDMCLGDILMLQEITKLYHVTTEITEEGNPCIEVISKKRDFSGYQSANSEGGTGAYYKKDAITNYCEGALTYITEDTTVSTSMDVSLDFWLSVIEGYLQTETQTRESFYEMFDSLEVNGAQVIRDLNTITVIETTINGEELTSVYNRNNYTLMHTEFKDENGNVRKQIAYLYTCSPEGIIIPKMIYTSTTDTSVICRAEYEKKEWLKFDNYSINL